MKSARHKMDKTTLIGIAGLILIALLAVATGMVR